MFRRVSKTIRFALLAWVKSLRYVFYPTEIRWLSTSKSKSWKDVQLILLLNHTSLVEPIYAGIVPFSYLWQMASRLVFPVADDTLRKPISGRVLKLFAPRVVSLTRKRDQSWSEFLNGIYEDSILIFMPEGRMKRPNGLDKTGNPMTVKGGVVEVLKKFNHSKLLIAYSGGLHHVLAPGQRFPRIFRRLKINLEVMEISYYLEKFGALTDFTELRTAIVKDLEMRRDQFTPSILSRRSLPSP